MLKNMAIKKKMMALGDEVVPNVGFSNKGISDESSEEKEYPYCLRLYLGPDELSSLGIEKLPELGSVLQILASAKVCELKSDEKYGNSLVLQITDMAVKSAGQEKKDPSVALYGENKED